MADTLTNNLQMTKPEPGGSEDTWGTKFNANLDKIDAIFASNGSGTSVGLNVGVGKTLSLAGTMNADGTLNLNGSVNVEGTLTLGQNSEVAYESGASAPWVWSGEVATQAAADKIPRFGPNGPHLGMAMEPYDWHSSVPALDFWGATGNKGAISGNFGALDLTQNAYYTEDLQWIAKDSGTAMQFHMVENGFWWYIHTGVLAGNQVLNTPYKMHLDTGGSLHLAGVLWQGSDRNLKEAIKPLAASQKKGRLSKLLGRAYRRKGSKRQEIGLIAQEVQAVIPEAVMMVEPEKKGTEAFLAIDYSALTVLLIEEVKELQERLKQLEAKP